MDYRKNTDANLRDLERRARQAPDDLILAQQLEIARDRIGLCLGCGGKRIEGYHGRKHCLACKPLVLRWDTDQNIQDRIRYLMEEGNMEGPMSQVDATIDANEDFDLQNWEWESMTETLTQWIEEINPKGNTWCVSGRNMGWQRRSGTKEILHRDGSTGQDLLRAILPQTDCTFTITYDGKSFEISNSHHDGSESYSVYVAWECPYCGENYCEEEDAKNCCHPCQECQTIYKTAEEAIECCPPPACSTCDDEGYLPRESSRDPVIVCPNCSPDWRNG
jgi:hypothetical protein